MIGPSDLGGLVLANTFRLLFATCGPVHFDELVRSTGFERERVQRTPEELERAGQRGGAEWSSNRGLVGRVLGLEEAIVLAASEWQGLSEETATWTQGELNGD